MKHLASHVLESLPQKLIRACHLLDQVVGSAQPPDTQLVIAQLKEYMLSEREDDDITMYSAVRLEVIDYFRSLL